MSQEPKPLQPGRYIISSKLVHDTEIHVIGIKQHLFNSTLRSTDARAPVMYIPRAFMNPSWTVSEAGDGTYVLELDGHNAVADSDNGLLFAEKEGKSTWKVKQQKNDTENPRGAYTIESASEPGKGWVLDRDKPDENTQPKEYVSNALWFFGLDRTDEPIAMP